MRWDEYVCRATPSVLCYTHVSLNTLCSGSRFPLVALLGDGSTTPLTDSREPTLHRAVRGEERGAPLPEVSEPADPGFRGGVSARAAPPQRAIWRRAGGDGERPWAGRRSDRPRCVTALRPRPPRGPLRLPRRGGWPAGSRWARGAASPRLGTVGGPRVARGPRLQPSAGGCLRVCLGRCGALGARGFFPGPGAGRWEGGGAGARFEGSRPPGAPSALLSVRQRPGPVTALPASDPEPGRCSASVSVLGWG